MIRLRQGIITHLEFGSWRSDENNRLTLCSFLKNALDHKIHCILLISHVISVLHYILLISHVMSVLHYILLISHVISVLHYILLISHVMSVLHYILLISHVMSVLHYILLISHVISVLHYILLISHVIYSCTDSHSNWMEKCPHSEDLFCQAHIEDFFCQVNDLCMPFLFFQTEAVRNYMISTTIQLQHNIVLMLYWEAFDAFFAWMIPAQSNVTGWICSVTGLI